MFETIPSPGLGMFVTTVQLGLGLHSWHIWKKIIASYFMMIKCCKVKMNFRT